jgi:hypothetical protein
VESLQLGIAVMPNNNDAEDEAAQIPAPNTPRMPSRGSKTRSRSAGTEGVEEPRTPAQTLARVVPPLAATTAAFSPYATSPAATPDGFVPMQLQFTPELVPPSCTPKRSKSGAGNPTHLARARSRSSPSPAQPSEEPLPPVTLEALFSPLASHSPALRSARPIRSLTNSTADEHPERTPETRVIAAEEDTAGSHRPFAEPFPEPLPEHRQPAAVPMFDFGGWLAAPAVAPIYTDSTDAAAEGLPSTEAERVAEVEAAPTEQEPMVAEGAAAERGRRRAATEVGLDSRGVEGENAEAVFIRITEECRCSAPSTTAHAVLPERDIERDDADGTFAQQPDGPLAEKAYEEVTAAAAEARMAGAAREAAEKETAEVAVAEPPDEASVVLIAAEASTSGNADVSAGVRSSSKGNKKKKRSRKGGR